MHKVKRILTLKNNKLKKNFTAVIVLLIFSACSKSDTTQPKKGVDLSKFVDKDWYWEGKHEPQWITERYNSDHTGSQIQCTWIVPPYQFDTTTFNWDVLGDDSISVSNYQGGFSFKFKIFAVGDSTLTTNNWVVGGISDTSKTTFTNY